MIFQYCTIVFLIGGALSNMDYIGTNNYMGNDPFPGDKKSDDALNSISKSEGVDYDSVYESFQKFFTNRFADKVMIARNRSLLKTYSNLGDCFMQANYETLTGQEKRVYGQECLRLFDADVNTLSSLPVNYNGAQSWWAVDLVDVYLLQSVDVLTRRYAPEMVLMTSQLSYGDVLDIVTNRMCLETDVFESEALPIYTFNVTELKISTPDKRVPRFMVSTFRYARKTLARLVRLEFLAAPRTDDDHAGKGSSVGISEIIIGGELTNEMFNVAADSLRYCPLMDVSVNDKRVDCKGELSTRGEHAKMVYGFPKYSKRSSSTSFAQCIHKLFDGEVIREKHPQYIDYVHQFSLKTRENKWKIQLKNKLRISNTKIWLDKKTMSINRPVKKTDVLKVYLNSRNAVFACKPTSLIDTYSTSRVVRSYCKPYSTVPWSRYIHFEWSATDMLYAVEEIVISSISNEVSKYWLLYLINVLINGNM